MCPFACMHGLRHGPRHSPAASASAAAAVRVGKQRVLELREGGVELPLRVQRRAAMVEVGLAMQPAQLEGAQRIDGQLLPRLPLPLLRLLVPLLLLAQLTWWRCWLMREAVPIVASTAGEEGCLARREFRRRPEKLVCNKVRCWLIDVCGSCMRATPVGRCVGLERHES